MNMDMNGQSGSMSSMPMNDAGSMSSMSSMNSDNMPMSNMSMAFFNSMKTTLFTDKWTPNGMGSYAATCFFLVFLASSHRFLFALKSWLEMYWRENNGSEISYEEDLVAMKKRKMSFPPWRLTVDPLRAILDTLTVAVGFFLYDDEFGIFPISLSRYIYWKSWCRTLLWVNTLIYIHNDGILSKNWIV